MSNGDFYPTDKDERGPTPDLPELDFWIIMGLVFFLLFILGMVLIGMYFSSHPTPLTLPAGSCLAPLCALIFRPRFVAKVMDMEGNRIHTAYPHHDIRVKPEAIQEEGRVLYETQGSTWRGQSNQRTFIVYAFRDTNGNWVHCGNLDE